MSYLIVKISLRNSLIYIMTLKERNSFSYFNLESSRHMMGHIWNLTR